MVVWRKAHVKIIFRRMEKLRNRRMKASEDVVLRGQRVFAEINNEVSAHLKT